MNGNLTKKCLFPSVSYLHDHKLQKFLRKLLETGKIFKKDINCPSLTYSVFSYTVF